MDYQPVEGIDWAKARFDSVRGPVAVRWEKSDRGLFLDVSLAANTTGRVYLPEGYSEDVKVNGAAASDVAKIEKMRGEGGESILLFGSGVWKLELETTP